MAMEAEAVIHAIQWLAFQRDTQITNAIILTDPLNLLRKVKSGMGCPGCHTDMLCLRLHRLLWTCPGHVSLRGNERADRLGSSADNTSGEQLSRAEVLRGLRSFLNMYRPEHHSTVRLKEKEWRKESADIPISEVGNDLCSIIQTLVLSRGQPWGHCREMGRSAFGAFPSATKPS